MSYSTFHKIRQLDNGDFIVTTKCSNDGVPPHEWTMDYYRLKFPTFTNRQREAALILSGLYSGDVYYPEKYKRLQRLACEYSKKAFENSGKYPYPIYDKMSREGYERDKRFYEERGIKGAYSSYEEYVEALHKENLFAVDGFITYVDEQQVEPKMKAIVHLLDYHRFGNAGNSEPAYVSKMQSNSKSIQVTPYKESAKVFHKPRTEIEKLLKRIPVEYKAVIEVV